MTPLVLITVAWVAGLVAAHHILVPVGVGPEELVILCVIPLTGLLLWPRNRNTRLGSVCALALLLGALRYHSIQPNPIDARTVAFYNDSGWVNLEGIVTSYPDVRDAQTHLVLRVDRLWLENDPGLPGEQVSVTGSVLIYAPRVPERHYGDRLHIAGHLESPPQIESFDYPQYLARQGIRSVVRYPQIEHIASNQGLLVWRSLYGIRSASHHSIARLLPEPEAALLQGILLGIESGIPDQLAQAFKRTGTSHILVISGANITLLAGVLSATLGRILGKRRAFSPVLAGIGIYVLLVGADPAVLRAGLMGTLYVMARHLGRRAVAHVSLCASAFLMTIINPWSLWSIGFQLSFAATLSLILFAPPLEEWLEQLLGRVASVERARQVVRYSSDTIIVTLAAQVLTIPVLVSHFQTISPVTLLANILILPVQPPIMLCGAFATLLGFIPAFAPVAQAVAWLPWLLLRYTSTVVLWIARWPWASFELRSHTALWLCLGYGLLITAAWVLLRQRSLGQRISEKLTSQRATQAALFVTTVSAILIAVALTQLPDGLLHVAFLDVGQGDAILVTTPQGQQVLIDGGPSPDALASSLGRHMPFWDRSIDLVIMTHADTDHATGLVDTLERYRVGAWMEGIAAQAQANELYTACQQCLNRHAVPRIETSAGSQFSIGHDLVFRTLYPLTEPMCGTRSDTNNNSVVLRLSYRDISFLFTGDVESEAEAVLVQSQQTLRSDVLKISHHGSAGASSSAFLAQVAPRYAVISAGEENHFGHPAPQVLERIAATGPVQIFRTDHQGTIEVITDGHDIAVKTER